MAQIIKLKRSSTPGQVPTTSQLALGELAINTADGKMFFKKDDGSQVVMELNGAISGSSTSTSTGSTAPTDPAPTSGDLWYDTANGKMMTYNGTSWNEVGSEVTSMSNTGSTTLGTTTGDALTVNATSTFNAPLTANGNLTTTANSTLGDADTDTLTVNATSTFNADATFNEPITANDDITANGNTTLGDAGTDTLTVNAASTFNASATFGEPVTFNDAVTITDGQVFTLGGFGITDVRKFNIYDSSGAIVNGFYVMDTDTTATN